MDDLPENFRNTGICIGGPLDHERHVFEGEHNVIRATPSAEGDPPESLYYLVCFITDDVAFGIWRHESITATGAFQALLDHYVTNTGSQTPAGS